MLVSCMNLKNGKVFTGKFVGTGPSYFEKKNLPGRGLTKAEKHYFIGPEDDSERVETCRPKMAFCVINLLCCLTDT